MIESELLCGFIAGFYICIILVLVVLFISCVPSNETLKAKFEQFPKRK